ncbi:hypothetical protein FOA52_012339 [Chlamydomonas sp. UWO 241]|nr:hypothetical protein FOA52_012339 [Chlamydomonas sp. UWO 241]
MSANLRHEIVEGGEGGHLLHVYLPDGIESGEVELSSAPTPEGKVSVFMEDAASRQPIASIVIDGYSLHATEITKFKKAKRRYIISLVKTALVDDDDNEFHDAASDIEDKGSSGEAAAQLGEGKAPASDAQPAADGDDDGDDSDGDGAEGDGLHPEALKALRKQRKKEKVAAKRAAKAAEAAAAGADGGGGDGADAEGAAKKKKKGKKGGGGGAKGAGGGDGDAPVDDGAQAPGTLEPAARPGAKPESPTKGKPEPPATGEGASKGTGAPASAPVPAAAAAPADGRDNGTAVAPPGSPAKQKPQKQKKTPAPAPAAAQQQKTAPAASLAAAAANGGTAPAGGRATKAAPAPAAAAAAAAPVAAAAANQARGASGAKSVVVDVSADFGDELLAKCETSVSEPLEHDAACLDGPLVRTALQKGDCKGEDKYLIAPANVFTLTQGDLGPGASTPFAAFGVFDGHGGKAAPNFCAKTLLPLLGSYLARAKGDAPVLSPAPEGAGDLETDTARWAAQEAMVERLPKAMHAAFVEADATIQKRCKTSGTTATLAVAVGWTLTVASVGDSLAYLDTGSEIIQVSGNHRVGLMADEIARVEASGGNIGQSDIDGIAGGPDRVWPGGLMMTRTLGDHGAQGLCIPEPEVRQVTLPPGGARLVIASDGLWDACLFKTMLGNMRKMPPDQAANLAVRNAIKKRGLTDDITVLVIDFVTAPNDKVPASLLGGHARDASAGPTHMLRPIDAPSASWKATVASRRASIVAGVAAAAEARADAEAALEAEATADAAAAEEEAEAAARPGGKLRAEYEDLAGLRVDLDELSAMAASQATAAADHGGEEDDGWEMVKPTGKPGSAEFIRELEAAAAAGPSAERGTDQRAAPEGNGAAADAAPCEPRPAPKAREPRGEPREPREARAPTGASKGSRDGGQCRFFAAGKCTFAEGCRFSHGDAPAGAAPGGGGGEQHARGAPRERAPRQEGEPREQRSRQEGEAVHGGDAAAAAPEEGRAAAAPKSRAPQKQRPDKVQAASVDGNGATEAGDAPAAGAAAEGGDAGSAAARPPKPARACRYFQQGRCNAGEQCAFRHDAPREGGQGGGGGGARVGGEGGGQPRAERREPRPPREEGQGGGGGGGARGGEGGGQGQPRPQRAAAGAAAAAESGGRIKAERAPLAASGGAPAPPAPAATAMAPMPAMMFGSFDEFSGDFGSGFGPAGGGGGGRGGGRSSGRGGGGGRGGGLPGGGGGRGGPGGPAAGGGGGGGRGGGRGRGPAGPAQHVAA